MIVARFLDIIYSNGLFPSIFLPTRVISHSIPLIDNVFVNQSSASLNGLIKYNISDHFPVFVALNRCAGVHDSSCNPANYFCRLLTKFVFDKLNTKLLSESWSFVGNNTSVNDDFDNLVSVICNIVNKYAPLKHIKNKYDYNNDSKIIKEYSYKRKIVWFDS